MHPSEFFENCSLRIGIDTFEIFDEDLKKKLKSIHPKNFLKTEITLPVYKINLSYFTEKGNHKTVDRYAVMDSSADNEINFSEESTYWYKSLIQLKIF